jgi:Fibronectin type III domain
MPGIHRAVTRSMPIVAVITVVLTSLVGAAAATATDTPPPAPTILGGTPGIQQVSLTWQEPTTNDVITKYDVQYSIDGGQTWTAGAPTTGQPAPTSTEVDGLTDGTAYVFEVAAEDASSQGPWSSASESLTPADSSAVTTPASVVIVHGASATLSTTLTDPTTHAAIVGASVSLLNGNTAGVIKATTNVQGIATAAVQPGTNNRYQWKYAGTTGHQATFGGIINVSVSRAVQAALKAKKLKLGSPDAVYGTVSPNATGLPVLVQQRRPSGTWKTLPGGALVKRQKLPNGKKANGFVYPYTPTKKGKEKLRVECAPTSTNLAGVSATLRLNVTVPKRHHKKHHHKKS